MVLNGWVKSGAYNGAWGPAKALITIADGAAFDWVGKVDASSVPYSFVIAGDGPGHTGAMISSVAVDANGTPVPYAFFTDNYFSLLPHGHRTVRLHCPARHVPAAVRIRTWNSGEQSIALNTKSLRR